MSGFIKFADYFKKVIEEDMTAASAGVSGDGSGFSPDNSTSSDSYAPGDARMPTVLGKKKKGKKGKKSKGVKVQSRLRSEEDEESTHPGYEDTTWSDGDTTITMQDVEDKLIELKASVISIPVKDIAHLDVHTRNKPNKTPGEVKSTYDRAMKADLKYPIIITLYNGKYDMILDGNHRLHKAIEIGEGNIQAKVLDLSKTPDWLSVFG